MTIVRVAILNFIFYALMIEGELNNEKTDKKLPNRRREGG